MSREERTGWRDAALSERHRKWGYHCPAIDIDFLMLEYDTAKPVALVEYKNEQAPPQLPSHNSYRAIATLASRAGVPFFAVRYETNFKWFRIIALNPLAREANPPSGDISETEYRRFLMKIRGRV